MEISEDLMSKAFVIKDLSDRISKVFKEKNYDDGIKLLYIGIICVKPEFDFFFKIRKKYSRKDKVCEYDIKIDYSSIASAKKENIENIILEYIFKSLPVINELNIDNFDTEKLIKDFRIYVIN